ncbi:ABC transporter ATP-binding protein [Paenarthrobacter sp. NPDC057981]|uniref:ABC transporter ATP-binding protein n=1 Tax=Paenarthrobacter sp. NPDC057981 TaxID=3346297 RepID=UPI0036DA2D61
MAEILLAAHCVSRSFGSGGGVHKLDLDVAAGEIHALVGLNGAGKSTLMRLLLGLLVPDSGDVTIFGNTVRAAPSHTWSRVGQLIEYPFAYGELTGRANLEIGARLRGIPISDIKATVDDVLDELDLRRYAPIPARSLSLGNRQRLGLASALQHDPQLIVLDEPTNALDPAGVILLRESLLRRAARGAGVLVSSHHLDEVARVASRVTVINAGRVIGSIDPKGTDIEREFFALVHSDDARHKTRKPEISA